MSRSLSELVKKREIRRVDPDNAKAFKLRSKATDDLLAAQDMLKAKRLGWALAISYNSMLTAGLALMAKTGYWPSSDSHHVSVVQYCAHALGPSSSDLVKLFNRYRLKRHDVVYGEAESVGEDEAASAIRYAGEFLALVQKKLA